MEQTVFGLVDIGSNTIRLVVYKVEKDQFETVYTDSQNAGLIAYVKDGVMSAAGIERLIQAVEDFKKIFAALHVDGTAWFATASIRLCSNRQEILQSVLEKTGVEIELISGAGEARLSFEGARPNLVKNEGLYLDTGGGSSEVVAFNPEGIQQAISLPIGSLNLFETYVDRILPSKEEIQAMKERTASEIREAFGEKGLPKAQFLAITGGSMRAARSLMAALGWIRPSQMEFEADLLYKLINTLEEDPRAISRLILKTAPARIHTLCCGVIISAVLAKKSHASTIQICTTGVREGFLQEHLKGTYEQ